MLAYTITHTYYNLLQIHNYKQTKNYKFRSFIPKYKK